VVAVVPVHLVEVQRPHLGQVVVGKAVTTQMLPLVLARLVVLVVLDNDFYPTLMELAEVVEEEDPLAQRVRLVQHRLPLPAPVWVAQVVLDLPAVSPAHQLTTEVVVVGVLLLNFLHNFFHFHQAG
jgi:hypothetical protein